MPPKAKGKKHARESSEASPSPDVPVSRPPSKRIKGNTSQTPVISGGESSGSDYIPDRTKPKPQTATSAATKPVVAQVKPKPHKKFSRQQKSGDAFKKHDIKTGGIRFVDQVTPPQLVRNNKLTNLQRYNAVVNRFNATDDDTSNDPTSNPSDTSTATVIDLTGSDDQSTIQFTKQDTGTTKADTSAKKPGDTSTKVSAAPSKVQTPSVVPKQTKTIQTSTGLPASDTAAAKATKAKVLQQAKTGATSLDFILDEPVIDKRKYEAFAKDMGSSKGWAAVVGYKAPGKDKYTEVLKVPGSKDKYKEKDCESIAKKLARFCERWPFPIGSRDLRFKSNLFAVFSFDLFPNKGFDLRGMMLEKPRYKFNVNIIEPSTGEMVDEKITLAFDEFESLVKPIPSVPKHVASSHDTKLGPVDTSAKRNAVKFMKWVAWSFHGKIISSEGFQQAYANLQREFTGKFGVRVGNVKNPSAATKLNDDNFRKRKAGQLVDTSPTKIFRLSRYLRDDKVDLVPTPALLSTVDKPLPNIFIRSLSRGRLAFVTDAIDKSQEDDPTNLQKAWRVAVVAADTMNEAILRGDPPPSQCSCQDAQMSSITKHRCLGCLYSVLCSTMQPDGNGEPVCTNCAMRDARLSGPKKVRIARNRLKESLRLLISKEMYHWRSSAGKDDEAVKETGKVMLSATVNHISQGIVNDVEVPDAYVAANRRLKSDTRIAGRTDPFQASIDAAFPYGTYDNERRLHTPDNSVPTSLWINQTKAVFLPASLAVIAKYLNQDPTERGTDELLKTMDDIHKCNKVTGYYKKTRLGEPLVPVQHSKNLRMWQTATPPQISVPGSAKLYKYAKYSLTDGDIDEIDKNRIIKIVKQIEKKFNKRLPRAPDGCPWPSVKATMPKDWSWGNCWSLISERQQREWAQCNRHFEQVDVTETLFLEWVWQCADPAYVEFLGLPLVAYWFHPLRFAIGKKDHRKGMRTGWRSIKPTSIDDRDDALNNVLFETCTSNFLKHNFLDSDLVLIRQEFAKIVVPKKYFDPELRAQILAGISSVENVEVINLTDETEDGEDDAGGRNIDMNRVLAREEDSDDDNADEGEEEDADDDDEAGVQEERADTEVEPQQELLTAENDEEDAAMGAIEADVLQNAKQNVNQNSAALLNIGIPRPDLIRSAASDDIRQRLLDINADPHSDAVELRMNTIIRNRIINAEGMWSDEAINQNSEKDAELLMELD